MSGPPTDRRPRLPRLEPRRVGRVVLAFALSLAAWYLVRVPYTDVLLAAAKPILGAAMDLPPERVLKVDGNELVINTGVPSGRGPGRMLSLRNDSLYLFGWTVLLFWTLALSTSVARLKRQWPFVLLALGLVVSSQVTTLVLEVLKEVGSFRFEIGMPFLGADRHRGIVLSGEYLQVMAPILPIAFYLPVFLRRMDAADPSASGAGSATRARRGARSDSRGRARAGGSRRGS